MRSSDPIEGPLFPGLKRIIIIIFQPGSGLWVIGLWVISWTQEEKPCVSALKGMSKAEVAEGFWGVVYKFPHCPFSQIHFLVCLALRLNCLRYACQVHLELKDDVTCDLMAQTWRSLSCGIGREPTGIITDTQSLKSALVNCGSSAAWQHHVNHSIHLHEKGAKSFTWMISHVPHRVFFYVIWALGELESHTPPQS